MNPLQEQRIRLWNAELSSDIPLSLVLTNDKRSEGFRRFCDELSKTAPRISVLEKTYCDAELPSIRIGENLHYYAHPADAELEPFLEAVAAFGEGSAQIPEAVQSNFKKIDAPALLRLYITMQCPLCPWRVRQITPLAIINELLQLEIIDAALFPELAEKDSVQSVTTLILDGDFRWTSTTPLEEIVEILATRDPSFMSAPAIEEMLRIGNAEKVAQMMLKKGQIFPSFPGFLADEKFTTRLGAMVAAEEIARQNPALASRIVLPLWERFEGAGNSVKEDIIYVLGVSGNDQTVPMLESVLNDHCSNELKESASEAIERIHAKNLPL